MLTPGHDEALEAVKAKDFDPGRTVVLEGSEAARLPTGTPEGPVAGNLTNDGPNTVVVGVDAPRAGYLILADAYYPGWEATIDGQPTALLRADWVVRSVQVPAGHHQIEFRFRPNSLVVGGVISGVAWVIAIAAIVIGIARDQRRKKANKY
jgi:uncharacterized membrane protein YfhO